MIDWVIGWLEDKVIKLCGWTDVNNDMIIVGSAEEAERDAREVWDKMEREKMEREKKA